MVPCWMIRYLLVNLLGLLWVVSRMVSRTCSSHNMRIMRRDPPPRAAYTRGDYRLRRRGTCRVVVTDS